MRSPGRKPSNVYFIPAITARSRSRASALHLRLSTYHAILLRNEIYAQKPGLKQLPSANEESEQVRDEIPLSLPDQLHTDATQHAVRLGGTLSRLLETLVEIDTETKGPLQIWPISNHSLV